jgi:hypothetical protein
MVNFSVRPFRLEGRALEALWEQSGYMRMSGKVAGVRIHGIMRSGRRT